MNKLTLLAAGLMLTLQSTTLLAADLGKGTRAFETQDYTTALKELEPLAKEGNADALVLLGQMYENGWGVSTNQDKAVRFYDRGASQGHLPSVNHLRRLKNVEYKAEYEQILPQAEAGQASAQNRVGEMFEFGYGVTRNGDTAYSWYKKAAAQGLVAAVHNVGRAYNFGTGVKQDFAEAERWYRKAAEKGHMDAMFFLGTLYSNAHGQDTQNDSNVTAYAWMHNSAELGNATAAAIEKRLLMKLNETQTSEAKTLAEQYKARYVTPFQ